MTVAGSQITEAHRLAQASIARRIAATVLDSFGLIDLADLDATFPSWLRVVAPIIRSGHQESARLGGRYYARLREVEAGPGSFDTPIVAELAQGRLTASMSAVVRARAKTATAGGRALDETERTTSQSAARAAHRLTLEGGRDTVTRSISADRRAVGYARVTSGSPCAFCALLASAGARYKSGASFAASDAGFAAPASRPIPMRSSMAKVHDGCSCQLRPIFDEQFDLPEVSVRYRELWDEVSTGTSSQEALLRFRRRVEGRPDPAQAAG